MRDCYEEDFAVCKRNPEIYDYFGGQMSLMNNLKLHFVWEFIVSVGK